MGRMTEGFYAMHRGWQGDPDFEDDPFSRRDAWVWLIENAAHKDLQIDIKGHCCTLAAGQMMHSVRYLAEQWGWPLTRAQRFLDQVEKSGKIKRSKHLPLKRVSETQNETIIETPYNVITICKYVKYQVTGRNSETLSETRSETQFWNNNNNNDDKIYTNTPSETSRSEGLFFEILHYCGFASIPKDRTLVDAWLALPHATASDILQTCKDVTARLINDTGRAPFTLKVFDSDVRATIAKEQRRIEANRRHEQQFEEQEAQRIKDEERNALRIRALEKRYGYADDAKGPTVQ